jgi:hypothetical protein
MKRSKQLQMMVDLTNEFLRNNHIKDEGNDAFTICQLALLRTKTYHGFNMFKEKQIGDEMILVLAGTSDTEKFDCLQLY